MNLNAPHLALPETDLVRRACAGDRQAFSALVVRNQDRIYNLCYRMCHHEADALDMLQTTFLKAFEALPRFRADASFSTWLYRVAVNVVLTHRRRARARPTLALHAEHEPAAEPNRGESVERREQQEAVENALSGLDPEFRIVVVLKDIEELDYATIAQILEVPLGTVKSRIHRGRTLLAHMLRDRV